MIAILLSFLPYATAIVSPRLHRINCNHPVLLMCRYSWRLSHWEGLRISSNLTTKLHQNGLGTYLLAFIIIRKEVSILMHSLTERITFFFSLPHLHLPQMQTPTTKASE